VYRGDGERGVGGQGTRFTTFEADVYRRRNEDNGRIAYGVVLRNSFRVNVRFSLFAPTFDTSRSMIIAS